MSSWRTSIRLEALLYVVLIVIAAGLRFARLDWPPLNEAEATHALAALQKTPDASPFWSQQTQQAPSNLSYHVFTQWILQLVSPTESGARLISAIAGLGIVLTPLLLRRRLGAATTFATSMLLAISPAQIAVARTAGSVALAGFWLATAFGLAASGTDRLRRIMSLISLGFAFTSGPSVLTGLLGWAIGAAVVGLWRQPKASDQSPGSTLREFSRDLWIVPLVLLIVAGGLQLSLAGVGDLFQSLAVWFRGWAVSGSVPALAELAALPIYEPLILIAGLCGVGLALRRRDSFGRGVMLVALGALLVVVVYAGRNPEDLIWVVMPLALLGGQALSTLIGKLQDSRPWEAFGALASTTTVLVVFAYIQVAAYASGLHGFPVEKAWLLLALALAALALAGMFMVFFGLNWSWRLAFVATGSAGFMALTAFSLSAAWHLAFGPTAASGRELWRPQASTEGIGQLVETLESTALTISGRVNELEVRIEGEATASLAWALRTFRSERPREWFEEDQVPVILVPENAGDPKLGADYLGQTMVVGERWGWQGSLPPDLAAWWVSRRAPTLQERWLVLIRVDIATLGQSALPAIGDYP